MMIETASEFADACSSWSSSSEINFTLNPYVFFCTFYFISINRLRYLSGKGCYLQRLLKLFFKASE